MKDIDIDVSDSVHYTSTSHDATRPNTVNSNSSDMHELNETSDRFSLNEPHKQQVYYTCCNMHVHVRWTMHMLPFIFNVYSLVQWFTKQNDPTHSIVLITNRR